MTDHPTLREQLSTRHDRSAIEDHHIIIDGYGGWLIARRVAELYTAFANGLATSETPFLRLGDLLQNEIDYRGSAQFVRDQRYWLDRFADCPDPVSLSGRIGRRSGTFYRHTAHVSSSCFESLRALAQRTGTTLTQIVTAALAVHLHRLTGARDFALGMAVTSRIGSVAHRVPAMTSDVVPLRVAVRPDTRFHDVIRQVALEARRGLRHQRYRSEELRKNLGLLARDQPLFGPIINSMPFDYDLRFGKHSAST